MEELHKVRLNQELRNPFKDNMPSYMVATLNPEDGMTQDTIITNSDPNNPIWIHLDGLTKPGIRTNLVGEKIEDAVKGGKIQNIENLGFMLNVTNFNDYSSLAAVQVNKDRLKPNFSRVNTLNIGNMFTLEIHPRLGIRMLGFPQTIGSKLIIQKLSQTGIQQKDIINALQ